MAGAAAALAAWAGGAGQAVACRLALVLALDVSGSVDATEYAHQMQGIAWALDQAEVTEALLGGGAPVALAAFEWSASSYQRQVLDWRLLTSRAEIAAVADHLRRWRRGPAPESTGIGAALLHGGRVLQTAPDCWQRVIDLSADGRNNDWPRPRVARQSDVLSGVTINGLVIGQEGPHPGIKIPQQQLLSDYFRAEILQGPGAFLEEASGYEDYARAIARKLLREVTAPPVGRFGTPRPRRLAQKATAGRTRPQQNQISAGNQ